MTELSRLPGAWEVSLTFLEDEAAMEWGLTPSQWERQSAEDKARMMAYVRAKNMMQVAEAGRPPPRTEDADAGG